MGVGCLVAAGARRCVGGAYREAHAVATASHQPRNSEKFVGGERGGYAAAGGGCISSFGGASFLIAMDFFPGGNRASHRPR